MANVKYKSKEESRLAREKAKNEWKKEHTRCINVRYNVHKDKEILDKLDSVDNKADYIRVLVKKDIGEN